MTFIPLDSVAKTKDTSSEGYMGIVVDNADPLRLGRVRVAANGIFEANSIHDLPWLLKYTPAFLGGSTLSESFSVPELQSQVWISFPFKDTKMPAYSNYIYGQGTTTGEFAEDYPESYGFKDSSGTLFKVNKAKKEITIKTDKFTLVINARGDFILNGGKIELNGDVSVDNGATGTFMSFDGKLVIVRKGIIIGIG